MKKFFQPSKNKIILFILFSFEALHFTISKIINTDCGNSMGYCAPAPGSFPMAIIGLVLLPIKLIIIPPFIIVWPIVKYLNPFFEKCELNYSIGSPNCYIFAAILLFILLIAYYIYSCLLVVIIKKIKKYRAKKIIKNNY